MTQHQVAEKEYRISAVPDNKIEELKWLKCVCLWVHVHVDNRNSVIQ